MQWGLAYVISEWLIRLVMLVYVPRQRSAAASRTWLLLIFLLPWPGLILYALVGRISLPRYRLMRQKRAFRKIRVVQNQMRLRQTANPALPPAWMPFATLAARLGDFEPFGGNRVELLDDYDGSVRRMVADIDSAKHHVHLLYYIYRNDETGRQVTLALERAAARGVQCRVLMDAVGSKDTLRKVAPEMRNAGIKVHAVLPVGLFRRNAARYDLRNHRKIAVIDGCIGYSGSQNIADRSFVPGYPNQELVIRMTGPVVWQLQAVFLADHYLETTAALNDSEMFPPIASEGSTIAQVIPSGPGYRRTKGQELIIMLLYAARERVVLTTPYFVPDEPFLEAVCSTARRGVVVHLIVSAHANQLLTQLAQRSFYDELLEAGVRIYLYQPHFLHAKHLTIDSGVALIGSSNIDIRSFALNAEVNTLFYDSEVVRKLRVIQEDYFTHSELLRAEQWGRRPLGTRTLHGIARLADAFL